MATAHEGTDVEQMEFSAKAMQMLKLLRGSCDLFKVRQSLARSFIPGRGLRSKIVLKIA